MSAKLDMALDDVVMTERTARPPVGGIQKNTKASRGPMKPVVPNGRVSDGRESKIIVSNLPSDVTEKNVKPDAKRYEVELIRRSVLQMLELCSETVWHTVQTSITQTAVRKK
ncbi:MAG: hypothetical protein LQ346_003855 [Caloplaca aetnensis]|nr:MAG: hypothetical protein LQ346_003855 [Caloplaca aetnensis]